MSHDHGHDLSKTGSARLAWTLGLVMLYAAAEVVGGIASGSLALLADAGHMVSDAAAIGLTLFAMWFARRPPSPAQTFDGGVYGARLCGRAFHSARYR